MPRGLPSPFRVRRRWLVTGAPVLASILSLGPANAAPPREDGMGAQPKEADRSAEAKREFARGQRAFVAGDFRQAGDAFEAAYRLVPHHAPLWNAARAWHRAGELARAANLYARYLREAPPDAPDRGQATSSLGELARGLGRIDVTAPDATTVRVDGAATTSPEVYVLPGSHVVQAEGTAHGTRTCEVPAGGIVHVAFAPDDAAAAASATTTMPLESAPGSPARHGLSPLWLVGGGVLTVAAGTVAVVSGVMTLDARRTYDAAPTAEHYERGERLQTQTNVALGVTAGLAVLTGVTAIFFVDYGKTKGTSARMSVGPGSAFVEGSF